MWKKFCWAIYAHFISELASFVRLLGCFDPTGYLRRLANRLCTASYTHDEWAERQINDLTETVEELQSIVVRHPKSLHGHICTAAILHSDLVRLLSDLAYRTDWDDPEEAEIAKKLAGPSDGSNEMLQEATTDKVMAALHGGPVWRNDTAYAKERHDYATDEQVPAVYHDEEDEIETEEEADARECLRELKDDKDEEEWRINREYEDAMDMDHLLEGPLPFRSIADADRELAEEKAAIEEAYSRR